MRRDRDSTADKEKHERATDERKESRERVR